MNALVNKRKGLIGKIDLMKTLVSQHPVTPLDILQVQQQLKRLLEHREKNDNLFDDIIALCKDDIQIAANQAIFDTEDKRLDELEVTLQTILGTFPTPTAATTTATTGTGSADVKLPKLEIPKFDGDIMKWMSFYDLFVASVDRNKTLSLSQKLQHLKGLVTGEPSTLICGLQITDTNYSEAMKILKERYDDKRELIKANFDRLINQPVIQQENPATLQRLADTTMECVRSFHLIKIPMEQVCELLIMHIIQKKLDTESKMQWERKITPGVLPTFKQFIEFLNHQAKVTAAAGTIKSKSTKQIDDKSGTKKTTSVHYGEKTSNKCVICENDHIIYKCAKFLALPVADRIDQVKKHHLCFNCLQKNHKTKDCISQKHCQKCESRHHTFIHLEKQKQETAVKEQPSTTPVETAATMPANSLLTNNKSKAIPDVLLGTALVKIRDSYGQLQVCRALVDNGSEVSIITESCFQMLGLKRNKINLPILGTGETKVGTSKSLVSFTLFSTTKQFNMEVDAIVMSKITGKRPQQKLDTSTWSHIRSLTLADPNYHTPSRVDILLGSDVYPDILIGNKVMGSNGSPTAIETELGYILLGKCDYSASKSVSIHHTISNTENLNSTLKQFWELEEVPKQIPLSQEEEACEKHFNENNFRTPDGRYGVKLPFKENLKPLGESRQKAVQRLKHLERRFTTNPDLKKIYSEVIREYLELGHMEKVPESEIVQQNEHSKSVDYYYMPHHVVIKENRSTTKHRVVFDASAATTTGFSLNDNLMVGPKLQPDLVTTLTRFRTNEIAFTADIVKMYRQFLIHPDDTNYQRIVWRDSPDQPISDYRMLTCTFGTASAPYQAVKCLQKLAMDEKQDFPKATEILLRDVYVDDLMSGANNEKDAIILKDQLIQLTARGQLQLTKWSSNSTKLLESLPADIRETNLPLRIDLDETVKTLGLRWNPATDSFSFQVTLPNLTGKITKRVIASENAKIFDPLGFLSPVTIKGKLLLQKLWKCELDWDNQLPDDLQSSWRDYLKELPAIQDIRIARYLLQPDWCDSQLSLHGFCDSSEKAYAAVVYVRSVSENDIKVKLVAAKTKVAPLKQQSLPRLELCGAVLLSRLMEWVQDSLDLNIQDIYGWTDSTTVLAWIASPPQRWKTFVANRVAEIQNVIPYSKWNHVKGEENPADSASRGISPNQLLHHSLWWKGPAWLSEQEVPIANLEYETEEEKSKNVLIGTTEQKDSLVSKFSSFTKLLHVTAYCFRFVKQLRAKKFPIQYSFQKGFIQVIEMEEAITYWIKKTQADAFSKELFYLRRKKEILPTSKILSLAPFLDDMGVIRVGGRLKNSLLHNDKKFPILLPKKSDLTNLIVAYYHKIHLHAGPQLLLAILQNKYWILGGRDIVRLYVRNCITCVRHRAQVSQQIMGDLPAPRVQPGRPFNKTGVDFAGPFTLVAIKGRGQKTFKGYICLFVCFATRAIHLELATELSTEAFIGALQRFISRRGKCSDIYSDCGTNFVGANNELKKLLQSAIKQDQCNSFATDHGIKWHLNPAASPHFGGIWEAGVKSAKYHLKRVMGNTNFSLEEMSTILAQIEACLNSRPITAMSNDPTDLSPLTPGHFLVGDSLTAIPHPDITDLPENRLSRWERTQQVLQHFWRRWSQEYIAQLQQRQKWITPKENVKVGDLVLLKDDNLPPLKWRMGRVITATTGPDNKVRVVTVKTSTGNFERSIVKICVLPVN